MRVLLIDVNCKKGSTGKIVYDLYNSLNSAGHTAGICYGRGDKIEGENIYKFGLDWETKIHAGLARLTGLNGYFSPFSTKRLLRFVKRFQPDVVHIHELHAYFVNWKPLIKYLKKKNIKVVWTFHCEYMYTGKCGHSHNCDKWKSECKHCPLVKDYPKSMFFDFTKKMFKDKKKFLCDFDFTIVTPSKWLADRVRQSFLNQKEILVIHNGIDAQNVFYPRPSEQIEDLINEFNLCDKKIVLSVAPNVLSDLKGGKVVIELSKQFDGATHFVLIGADKDQKLGDKVTILKRTLNQDELAIWYSAADVFLICSKRENFPTTCLEAFCCGTQVVGIDAGGTKETVPAPYGAFFTEQNLDALVNAVKEKLTSPMLKKEVGALGCEAYDKAVMCREYMKLYESKLTRTKVE